MVDARQIGFWFVKPRQAGQVVSRHGGADESKRTETNFPRRLATVIRQTPARH